MPDCALRVQVVQGGHAWWSSRATASAPGSGVGQCLGPRERDLMDEVGDDLLDTGPGALAARQEDEAMAERRLGSSLHVGGDDVVPARGQRHGAGSLAAAQWHPRGDAPTARAGWARLAVMMSRM